MGDHLLLDSAGNLHLLCDKHFCEVHHCAKQLNRSSPLTVVKVNIVNTGDLWDRHSFTLVWIQNTFRDNSNLRPRPSLANPFS